MVEKLNVMPGVLYIVATPIGNMEDITLRALRVLGEVDCVAAEDTRVARKLFSRHGIRTSLVSYHDANEERRSAELIGKLKEGTSIAIVSNAGMPGLSDPGYRLVRRAIDEGVRVEVVPGPSAIVSALVVSGLPAHSYIFGGFLSKGKTEKKRVLADLLFEHRTTVFFEAPGRLVETLELIGAVLGPRRPVVLARELTKMNEEVVRGSVSDVLARIGEKPVKGEVVLLIGGVRERELWKKLDPGEHLRLVQEELGLERMEAIKLVARVRGVARNVIYKVALSKKTGRVDE